MKKNTIITLTTAFMILSSTNALAATKNFAIRDCTANSFNGLYSNYSGGMNLNFGKNNCLNISDISDLMNCYFNGNCEVITGDCQNNSNNGCNKNDCTEKPTTNRPSTEKPGIEKPDKPSTEKPGTETPDIEKPGENKPAEDQEKPSDNQQSLSTESQYAAEVVKLVNAERAKEGLSALKNNSTAQTAAVVRAKESVTSFSHTRPNGSSCFTALDEAGVNYSGAGENIAYGQRTPSEVVDAWMNSPGHRANIMNGSFTEIGVGCYKSGNTYYWAQFFIR